MKTNKAEIYKNAFRLFLQDNYEKVTVVKLEKAIGLSCRGIYHHTKDKLGLFKAVVDTYILNRTRWKTSSCLRKIFHYGTSCKLYRRVERTMDYLSMNWVWIERNVPNVIFSSCSKRTSIIRTLWREWMLSLRKTSKCGER